MDESERALSGVVEGTNTAFEPVRRADVPGMDARGPTRRQRVAALAYAIGICVGLVAFALVVRVLLYPNAPPEFTMGWSLAAGLTAGFVGKQVHRGRVAALELQAVLGKGAA